MSQTNTRSKSHKQMKSLEVLPAGELEDNIDLNNLPKAQLITIVEMLRNKNIELEQEYKNKIDKGLEILERVQNSSLQYIRRDTVEISGIPEDIHQKQLENEVIKIFGITGVAVEGQKLDKLQIHACHKIGKKGKTIVKTVNHKFAEQALFCSKNL